MLYKQFTVLLLTCSFFSALSQTPQKLEFTETLLNQEAELRIAMTQWLQKEKLYLPLITSPSPPRFIYQVKVLNTWQADINEDSQIDWVFHLQLIPCASNRLTRTVIIAFLQMKDQENKKIYQPTKVFWATEILKKGRVRVTEPKKLLRRGILIGELQYRSPYCVECIDKKIAIRLRFDKQKQEWLWE
ncbi:MAG: hypothetical protein RML72_02645 [Bacteroidia bacterium]|nr:hypothetical protein [Bacteroidia bacterium]MDW8157759.1 hypothetical protein [Bacteroidia bacterium]